MVDNKFCCLCIIIYVKRSYKGFDLQGVCPCKPGFASSKIFPHFQRKAMYKKSYKQAPNRKCRCLSIQCLYVVY